MRARRLVLCVSAAVVAWAGAAAGAQEREIRVETRVSWSSTLQPEVHILIRNGFERDLRFQAVFGYGLAGERVKCAGDLGKVDPRYVSKMMSRSPFAYGATSGIAPGGGWAHRSYPMGRDGLVPPCDIPYVVRFPGEEIDAVSGVIEVKRPPFAVDHVAAVMEDGLSIGVTVEKNLDKGGIVVRLLVENHAPRPTSVAVADRGFECEPGLRPSWVSHQGPLAGESIGPVLIPASGWAVLVATIDPIGNDTWDRCSGWIELETQSRQGPWVNADRVEFSLVPVGSYAPVVEHRAGRDPGVQVQ